MLPIIMTSGSGIQQLLWLNKKAAYIIESNWLKYQPLQQGWASCHCVHLPCTAALIVHLQKNANALMCIELIIGLVLHLCVQFQVCFFVIKFYDRMHRYEWAVIAVPVALFGHGVKVMIHTYIYNIYTVCVCMYVFHHVWIVCMYIVLKITMNVFNQHL